MSPVIPEPGDKLKVCQYTYPRPTIEQVNQFIANPWQPPTPGTQPIEPFPTWTIVCLRRSRKGEQVFITITSAEFPEPLRSQGIKVPLECCEILERGYGLPEMAVEAVEPVAAKVVPMPAVNQQELFGA